MEQRLVDADVLKVLMMADSLQMMLFGKKYELSDALKTVNNAPTVDAVPVIRCKDCKHWHRQYRHDVDISTCERTIGYFEANDYCSRAERKEK